MPLDEFLEHLNDQTDIDQPSKEVLERVAKEITEDVGGHDVVNIDTLQMLYMLRVCQQNLKGMIVLGDLQNTKGK